MYVPYWCLVLFYYIKGPLICAIIGSIIGRYVWPTWLTILDASLISDRWIYTIGTTLVYQSIYTFGVIFACVAPKLKLFDRYKCERKEYDEEYKSAYQDMIWQTINEGAVNHFVILPICFYQSCVP